MLLVFAGVHIVALATLLVQAEVVLALVGESPGHVVGSRSPIQADIKTDRFAQVVLHGPPGSSRPFSRTSPKGIEGLPSVSLRPCSSKHCDSPVRSGLSCVSGIQAVKTCEGCEDLLQAVFAHVHGEVVGSSGPRSVFLPKPGLELLFAVEGACQPRKQGQQCRPRSWWVSMLQSATSPRIECDAQASDSMSAANADTLFHKHAHCHRRRMNVARP